MSCSTVSEGPITKMFVHVWENRFGLVAGETLTTEKCVRCGSVIHTHFEEGPQEGAHRWFCTKDQQKFQRKIQELMTNNAKEFPQIYDRELRVMNQLERLYRRTPEAKVARTIQLPWAT